MKQRDREWPVTSIPWKLRYATRGMLRRLPSRLPGIIVASFGRSGSTLLYRSLVEAMSAARIGVRRSLYADLSWTLADASLKRGIVYKTHDYPWALTGRMDLRSVYVFGKASDAVLSVIEQEKKEGRDWVDLHLEHLKMPGGYDEILTRDALGIGAQLDAWTTFDESPVLCIRYEALWDSVVQIARFTGLPLELPERQARSDKQIDGELARKVVDIYGPLDDRIAALPDVFIAGKRPLAPLVPDRSG